MKKIIAPSLLFIALVLASGVFVHLSNAAPAAPPTSSSCTPPSTLGGSCPTDTPDYYSGACRTRILCSSGATSFTCSSGTCYTPPLCSGSQVDTNGTAAGCKNLVQIINDTVFKVWTGSVSALKRLVYVDDNSACTTGQVIQWNGTGWVCADAATISGISSVAGNPLFVGLSATLVQGNLGSYTLANNACYNGAGALSQSHICTAGEITDSYVASHVSVTTGTAWINAGSPANTFPAVNDCGGWIQNVNPYYGTVWNFSSKSAAIQPCFAAKQYACCK